MRRAVWLLALAGCFDWSSAAPSQVDAGGDAGKDAGDAGVDADASSSCDLAARKHDALVCNPAAASQCTQSMTDECSCTIFLDSLDSAAAKAYQDELKKSCGPIACSPCPPSAGAWTCKDDGTGTHLCAQ
jgi:hypothetical protein